MPDWIWLALRTVLLSATGCYVACSLFARRHRRRTFPAVVTFHGKSTGFLVLEDTGNLLLDPATGRGILVAELEVMRPVLPCPIEAAELLEPVTLLERLTDIPGSWQLMPYRTAGMAGGLLLTFRLEEGRIGKKRRSGLRTALVIGPLSEDGSYHGLIGSGEECT